MHPEAYRIWLRRDDEPGGTVAFGMRALLVLDDDDDKRAAHCSQIWRLALRHLKQREIDVLRFRYVHDLTLEETGERMSIKTRAHVRQIEARALRKLRQSGWRKFHHPPDTCSPAELRLPTVENMAHARELVRVGVSRSADERGWRDFV